MFSKNLLILKIFSVFVLVVVFSFYFFRQSKDFILGPSISVNSPVNGQTLSSSLVLVSGRVSNSSSFELNGQEVMTDSYGNFEKGLLLAKGYNIIELSAEDKYGRTANKRLEVVLE
ncbi:hypothetical protein ACFLY5_00990 [Patescibacteria group bacterium]